MREHSDLFPDNPKSVEIEIGFLFFLAIRDADYSGYRTIRTRPVKLHDAVVPQCVVFRRRGSLAVGFELVEPMLG